MLLVDKLLTNSFNENKGKLNGSAVCERRGILLCSAAVRTGKFSKLYHAARHADQPDFCWFAPLFTQFCTLRRRSVGELADSATSVTDSLLAAERSAGEGTGNGVQLVHLRNVDEPAACLAASDCTKLWLRGTAVSRGRSDAIQLPFMQFYILQKYQVDGDAALLLDGLLPLDADQDPAGDGSDRVQLHIAIKTEVGTSAALQKIWDAGRTAQADSSFQTTPCRAVSAAIVLVKSWPVQLRVGGALAAAGR